MKQKHPQQQQHVANLDDLDDLEDIAEPDQATNSQPSNGARIQQQNAGKGRGQQILVGGRVGQHRDDRGDDEFGEDDNGFGQGDMGQAPPSGSSTTM